MQKKTCGKNKSISVFVASLLAIATTGCTQWKWLTTSNAQNPDQTQNTQGIWQIKPVSMQIYPTTRFTLRGGKPILEMRIELSDDMKDPIKGVGTFTFAINSTQANENAKNWSYAWPHEDNPKHTQILTLQDNKDHFQSIDNCYVFYLGIDQMPKKGAKFNLSAQFIDPAGSRLDAARTITHQ